MKKVVSILLVLALVLSMTSAMALSVPTNLTSYLPSTNASYYQTAWIYISDVQSDDEHPDINVTTIKSSKPSVASIYAFERREENDEYYYYDDQRVSGYNYINFEIGLRLKKAGSTNVTFKFDGATYKTAVKVLKYTNPVASLKITGVEGGKELKSFTATERTANVKVTKNVADATVKAKAASGWKIRGVWANDGNGNYRSFSFSSSSMPASISLPLGKLTAGMTTGYVNVEYENVKTGASIDTYYYFRNND